MEYDYEEEDHENEYYGNEDPDPDPDFYFDSVVEEKKGRGQIQLAIAWSIIVVVFLVVAAVFIAPFPLGYRPVAFIGVLAAETAILLATAYSVGTFRKMPKNERGVVSFLELPYREMRSGLFFALPFLETVFHFPEARLELNFRVENVYTNAREYQDIEAEAEDVGPAVTILVTLYLGFRGLLKPLQFLPESIFPGGAEGGLGAQDEEGRHQMEARLQFYLDEMVKSAVRAEAGKYFISQIIRDKDTLAEEIRLRIKNSYTYKISGLGDADMEVEITEPMLPSDLDAAITRLEAADYEAEAKIVESQGRMQAKINDAKASKREEILEAEGSAEGLEILRDALTGKDGPPTYKQLSELFLIKNMIEDLPPEKISVYGTSLLDGIGSAIGQLKGTARRPDAVRKRAKTARKTSKKRAAK